MTPQQKAAAGLVQIKEAILDYLTEHPNGVRHSQIVTDLGLESDFEGKQRNYLSWSVVGLLVGERQVRYERRGKVKIYFRA
jgi:hypothetical protein